MKRIMQVALGLVTALGGFVDIGDLVFASQAGARFGYDLLWALALGTFIIMIYSEMSGRLAAIGKEAAFTLINQTYPKWLALTTLISSKFVNIMTCAAEIGGVALVLQLLSGLPLRALIIAVFLGLILIVLCLVSRHYI
jgi:manganese transport protein